MPNNIDTYPGCIACQFNRAGIEQTVFTVYCEVFLLQHDQNESQDDLKPLRLFLFRFANAPPQRPKKLKKVLCLGTILWSQPRLRNVFLRTLPPKFPCRARRG